MKNRLLSLCIKAFGYESLQKIGVELNLDTSFKKVNIAGKVVKNIDIISPILKADLVVNLPKLKTHAMMNLTCGVKNLFGIVPGMTKAEIHSIYPKYEDFANAIIDISYSVKNQITIVDAIDSMEGNGPNQGSPRHTSLILASKNQAELDYVAMKIINLPLKLAYSVNESLKRNLFSKKSLEIIGEKLEDCIIPDFKKPDSIKRGMFKYMINISRFLKPYPIFNKDKCIKCKLCINRCPAHVLELRAGRVVLTSKKECIRCFCCSEHCPADAISIKHQLIFSKTGQRAIKGILGIKSEKKFYKKRDTKTKV
ncbi:MAG: DUF362 domain-containing protein [Clostridia bacterium]